VDFGLTGTGLLTSSDDSVVPLLGLDPFGRVLEEVHKGKTIFTSYNPSGEVISQGEIKLLWDPWGRLVQVKDSTASW
jgi:hypothetical protein